MGIGMSQEECDNSCDREIRMYQKEEERCRFDKKELKSDSEKYKEEIDELTDKFNDFEAECKKEVNKYKNKRVMAINKCYKSCGSCEGPGPLDCTSCRDGSNIIDKDGDGAGSCGNEIISEMQNVTLKAGGNSGLVRINREMLILTKVQHPNIIQ